MLMSLFLLIKNERLSLSSYMYIKAVETMKRENNEAIGGNNIFKILFLLNKSKYFFFL